MLSTRKDYAYCASQYARYGLTDTAEEMISLLNILEAHGETLESLHETEGDIFCNMCILKDEITEREIAEGLQQCNRFIPFAELEDYIHAEEENGQTMEDIMNGLTRTTDGYVETLLV